MIEAAMIPQEIVDRFRIEDGEKFRLKDHETGWAQMKELKEMGKAVVKERANEILQESREQLAAAQDLLYADDRYAILVVLQAMDAAGKDGTIKHVMSGVNPQGCEVHSFKKPSDEELDHTFLWRCMRRLPERGRIGIFNRSYYEDVLVAKVHRELLDHQRLPPGGRGRKFWEARYDDINAFERHLVRNGTILVKVFLNVSRKEQKRRFLDRLDSPDKNWKFSAADIAERAFWDQYMEAFEDVIRATSTKHAPWYVVPADDKWFTRAVVADVLATTIHSLDLKYPEVTEAQRAALTEARKRLEAE
jgi:PPK2 family polyphosphate:nucleotide phosphotransferase